MMYETEESRGSEHSELLDMRTHLTVAMLAASQLNRKTYHLQEAAHLQEYLDQSLKSLVEDIGKVDALIAQVEEYEPIMAKLPRRRGLVGRFQGVRNGVKHGVQAFCARLHHRHYTRIVAPSLYR